MPLRDEISTPDRKRRYVRRLFATIADRYDLITRLLSYGQDRRWKRRLVALSGVNGSDRALDLATGTGDIAFAIADRGARVIGLDITSRMLALPFPNASFDLVTTGYGLRNVPDLGAAVDEIARVLKPGGRLLSLDFNRPDNAIVRAVYLAYLSTVGGAVGWVLHRDPDTYRYIPASIRTYPGANAVARLIAARGFVDSRYRRVLGGLMAIHEARKPDGPQEVAGGS